MVGSAGGRIPSGATRRIRDYVRIHMSRSTNRGKYRRGKARVRDPIDRFYPMRKCKRSNSPGKVWSILALEYLNFKTDCPHLPLENPNCATGYALLYLGNPNIETIWPLLAL